MDNFIILFNITGGIDMTTSKTSSNENQVGADKTREYTNWLQALVMVIPFAIVTATALSRFIETFGEYSYVAEENPMGIYLLWAVFNIVALVFLCVSEVKSGDRYITAIIFGLAPIILNEILAESQKTVFDYIGTERGGFVFWIIIISLGAGSVIIMVLNPILSGLAYAPSILLIHIYHDQMRYPLETREMIMVAAIFVIMSTVAGVYSEHENEKTGAPQLKKFDICGLFFAYNLFLFLIKLGRKYENDIVTNIVKWIRGSAVIQVSSFEILAICLISGLCFVFLCRKDYKYAHAALSIAAFVVLYLLTSTVGIATLLVFTALTGGFTMFCTIKERIPAYYMVYGFILIGILTYILQTIAEFNMQFALHVVITGATMLTMLYGKIEFAKYEGTLLLGIFGTCTMIATRYDILGILANTTYDITNPFCAIYDNTEPSIVVLVLCIIAAIFFWAIAAYLLKPEAFKLSVNINCMDDAARTFARMFLLNLPVFLTVMLLFNFREAVSTL